MATPRLDHPRIWLNNDTLPSLKARAAAGDERWTSFLSMVDTHMQSGWDVGPISYSLAYLVTGRANYADAALALLDLWSADPIGAISGDSGYQCRVVLPGMAVGFDYCYSHLTAAQKARYVSAMEDMAAWIWPETNPSRTGAWGTGWSDSGNNYYSGFLVGSWLAGLSLYGDSAKAQQFIDVSRSRYDRGTLPYMTTGMGRGGIWSEDGTSYGASSTSFVFQALEANFSASGEDLLSGSTWARDVVTTILHTTAPTMDRRWPWGDQPRASAGYLDDVDRTGMLLASRWDPRAALWCDSISSNRATQRLNMYQDFLFYKQPLPMEAGQ